MELIQNSAKLNLTLLVSSVVILYLNYLNLINLENLSKIITIAIFVFTVTMLLWDFFNFLIRLIRKLTFSKDRFNNQLNLEELKLLEFIGTQSRYRVDPRLIKLDGADEIYKQFIFDELLRKGYLFISYIGDFNCLNDRGRNAVVKTGWKNNRSIFEMLY